MPTMCQALSQVLKTMNETDKKFCFHGPYILVEGEIILKNQIC